MGRKYLDSGNYAQARTYLEQAVQGGDGAAACHLGEMTLKGQGGIPADQEKAAKLFQIAISKNIICFASGK
jgi:TPR repeat protein